MRRSNTFKNTVHRVARGAEYHGENYEGELQGPRQKKSTVVIIIMLQKATF